MQISSLILHICAIALLIATSANAIEATKVKGIGNIEKSRTAAKVRKDHETIEISRERQLRTRRRRLKITKSAPNNEDMEDKESQHSDTEMCCGKKQGSNNVSPAPTPTVCGCIVTNGGCGKKGDTAQIVAEQCEEPPPEEKRLSLSPTRIPTSSPTKVPTRQPSKRPTSSPSSWPSKSPSSSPSMSPSSSPSKSPSSSPSNTPSSSPSESPSSSPSKSPSSSPSKSPSSSPSKSPSSSPSKSPSSSPSESPTSSPSESPTSSPSRSPSSSPSRSPSSSPSKSPSSSPSALPSSVPSSAPTNRPSNFESNDKESNKIQASKEVFPPWLWD